MELTDDQIAEALYAKRREVYYANEARLQAEERARRRAVFQGPWTAEQMHDFVIHRAHTDPRCGFSTRDRDERPEFELDDQCRDAIMALCLYFTNDPRFEALRIMVDGEEVPLNFKLGKGILLAGPKGTGKTSIMRLFNRNKRACYELVGCKNLVKAYNTSGEKGGYGALTMYEGPLLVVKGEEYFYQEKLGVCFEDLGTEEEGSHYGSKLNVMRYLIEMRYDAKLPYWMTHGTTNLDVRDKDLMERVYGERAVDRMTEMWNVIYVGGESRRR